eukprot:13480787-Heterocapsa_arctica.AAC.1
MGTRTVVLMEDPVPVTALVTPCSVIASPVPVTALAMPCQPVVPRRKPKFIVPTRGDIEEYPVDLLKKYGYAIDHVRD